jgi:hypothetical protein
MFEPGRLLCSCLVHVLEKTSSFRPQICLRFPSQFLAAFPIGTPPRAAPPTRSVIFLRNRRALVCRGGHCPLSSRCADLFHAACAVELSGSHASTRLPSEPSEHPPLRLAIGESARARGAGEVSARYDFHAVNRDA